MRGRQERSETLKDLAPPDARERLEGRGERSGPLILTLSLLLVAGTAWAAWAKVEEVVRAPGQVEPAGRVKLVNHPQGGRVTELLVQDGDTVRAGEVLLRLDGKSREAERAEMLGRWQVSAARAARLRAEADGEPLALDPALAETRPDLAEQEEKLLAARSEAAAERRRILERSIETHKGGVAKAAAEVSRLEGSLDLLAQQSEAVRELAERGLYPKLKMVEIEGQLNDAKGELKKSQAGLAAARAALAEAESRLAGFDKDARSEVLDQLGKSLAERDRLAKLLEGDETRVRQLALRAPADGVVQDLAVTAAGQSVGPNEPLMKIVPLSEGLVVKARVANDDIARVKEGMAATVKVQAYNFARYGSLPGTVEQIAADASKRTDEPQPAYGITVLTDRSSLSGDEALQVAPGMLVDVELQVGQRSILSFLTEGIVAWREDALKEL